MSNVTIHHRVPRADLGLGLVYVECLTIEAAALPLSAKLEQWIQFRRAQPLTDREESFRQSSRGLLRNGQYKPTGRGKPASEYLMRAAAEGNFPRINGPVDANNLISLKYCVPISLWDLDLADTNEFEIRLGHSQESYIFNPTGQVLALGDLICGCGLHTDQSIPLVTPVKDSLATKIQSSTSRVAGCIYYPLSAGSKEHLIEATQEFLTWLLTCGASPKGAWAVAKATETVSLAIA